MTPRRVQQRRLRGWRKPSGAVSVARGTRWGNPFHVTGKCKCGPNPAVIHAANNAEAVMLFRGYLVRHHGLVDAIRHELRGKSLMCWCKPDEPCHADVLLFIANQGADQ